MAYGFVAGYLLALLFANLFPWSASLVLPLTAFLALVSLFGGAIPDLDQLEFWGPTQIRKYFVHKKTCHYIIGYAVASAMLFVLADWFSQYTISLLALACVSLGASAHCLMDPLDGWRDEKPRQGIYEHVTKQWLPSLRLVMFAGLWEWVIQALAAVGFIAISANLPQLVVPGWKIATLVYFVIWIISVVFDALHRGPKRQAIEEESIRALRGLR
jgi:hypothetical protein